MGGVGLVLGGGGAVGHGYHGGVLAALAEHGFDARRSDVVVGTSSGAVVAGLVRAGVSADDLLARACRSRSSGDPRLQPMVRVGPPASIRGALAAVGRRDSRRLLTLLAALLPTGATSTRSAGTALSEHFGATWPDEALWVSAVAIDDSTRVMFGRPDAPQTDVATAVAASCALPGLFTPVRVDGARYIDGAVWSATNADALAGVGLDTVIVSAPLSSGVSPLHRWQRRQMRREVATLRADGVEVIVIGPDATDAGVIGLDMMNPGRRGDVARHMHRSVRRRLDHGDLARDRDLICKR
jgi:NTE family protein